jgi:hypothetical protein
MEHCSVLYGQSALAYGLRILQCWVRQILRMSPNLGLRPSSAHSAAIRGSTCSLTKSLATTHGWSAAGRLGGVDFRPVIWTPEEVRTGPG